MDYAMIMGAVVSVLIVAATLLITFMYKKGWVDKTLNDIIRDASQRAGNQYTEKLLAAQGPESDGGIVITPAEKSEARNYAMSIVWNALKGPGLGAVQKLAISLGEHILKGRIGSFVDAMLAKANITTHFGTPDNPIAPIQGISVNAMAVAPSPLLVGAKPVGV